MNRSKTSLAVTSLALAAGVGLTACSQPASAPAPGPSANPASSPTQDPAAAAAPNAPAQQAAHPNPASPHSSLADGRHPARLTAVNPSGEQVTIDVVQFFFGDTATEAARADGSTNLPPPNDYWIRNVNPRLRSLPVAPHTPVTVNLLSAAETGDSQTNSTISLSKLASYGDIQDALFWVTTRDGAVTGIAQQWMP